MEAARKRQDDITFGGFENGVTADVEADETVVAKYWDTELINGVQTKVWHYYVWLGILQRGDPEKMYLTPVGMTHSIGSGRMSPLSNDF